ncbi:MAG: RHS repeat-associated core domain-containing protein [Lachnospiraceae bacterium]|nr:RHS repeat-associated core domain-containing protein [Lachnospiraceae bacterium]
MHTGQQYDQETGQYYLRARYYNPTVGRFIQEDTYRGDGLNLYAYCGNNPVAYYDPDGHAGAGICPPPNQAEQENQVSAGEGGGATIKSSDLVFGSSSKST